MKADSNNLAKKALIQLYLTVKIRKEDEADNITREQLAEEENNLIHLPLLSLINYVKSSIDTIIALKLEDELNKSKDPLTIDYPNAAHEYETLLRKEEGEIRQHICTEHQLKIHIEKMADELEELSKENSMLRRKLKKKNTVIEKKQLDEKNILTQNNEIENLKKIIQSYEEKLRDISLKESKLKVQLIEKEKENKKLESKLLIRKNGAFMVLNKDKYKVKESLSSNSSICSHSCSKNKVTDEEKKRNTKREISPVPFEKNQMFEKLEKYRVFIDKKVTEATRNKKQLGRERSCASVSYNIKERSINNDLSMIEPKKDLTQRFNETARQGYTNEIQKNNNMSMKKIPFPDNTFKKNGVYSKKKQNISYNTSRLQKKNQSSIPIVISQSEVPCVNNINIYAGNSNSVISDNCPKNSQVNLRQYIFTKYGSNNLINKIRSNSKG